MTDSDWSLNAADQETFSDCKFTLRKIIGSGTFGEVYEAEAHLVSESCSSNGTPSCNRKVAIKMLKEDRSDFQNNCDVEMRYEADVMNAIGSHPNIVTFHGAFKDNSTCYLVMERLEGKDLTEYLPDIQSKERDYLYITSCVLQAVVHIHEKGYTHNDIKADNIVVKKIEPTHDSTNRFEVKLIDFGHAFHKDEPFEELLGTYEYNPPEFWTTPFDEIDFEKADVWSVGVTLYNVLNHDLLFEDDCLSKLAYKIRHAPITFKGVIMNAVSNETKNFLKKMLDRNPNTRIDAREALRLVNELLQ